jgi:glutaredoxin 2
MLAVAAGFSERFTEACQLRRERSRRSRMRLFVRMSTRTWHTCSARTYLLVTALMTTLESLHLHRLLKHTTQRLEALAQAMHRLVALVQQQTPLEISGSERCLSISNRPMRDSYRPRQQHTSR